MKLHPGFAVISEDADAGEGERPVLTLQGAEHRSLTVRAKAMVFADPASKALLGRIAQIAPSDATVLVTGETGTGKEIVARHVHELSPRRGRPFVGVNCGAFSETLVESELFGHERGAFTGAFAAKAGWFEAANGGTLFLDEVGDLPPSVQVKLLRVLQEREVVRVGARRPIPIDVRLVAATNVDLRAAVEAGRFREDLYFRIAVADISLPPLRDRPGDIVPLAQYFLGRFAQRMGLKDVVLSGEAAAVLLTHAWPGNIRELENVIHQAVLVCRNGRVEASDLHLNLKAPGAVRLARSAAVGAEAARERAPLGGFGGAPAPEVSSIESDHLWASFDAALLPLFDRGELDADRLFEQIDARILRAAYDYCGRNQLATARLLGLSRNVIRARLIQYGLIRGSLRRSQQERVAAPVAQNSA